MGDIDRGSKFVELVAMEIPIIINNRGDLLIFGDLKLAESYLEPVDVQNQEYVAYDAKGRLLDCTVEGHRVVIRPAEAEPTHQEALRNTLISFFARIGWPTGGLDQASLEQLVAKSLEYKTQ